MSNGVYTIYPSGVDGEEVTVYCQFDAEGDWTVSTDVILETDHSYSCSRWTATLTLSRIILSESKVLLNPELGNVMDVLVVSVSNKQTQSKGVSCV